MWVEGWGWGVEDSGLRTSVISYISWDLITPVSDSTPSGLVAYQPGLWASSLIEDLPGVLGLAFDLI